MTKYTFNHLQYCYHTTVHMTARALLCYHTIIVPQNEPNQLRKKKKTKYFNKTTRKKPNSYDNCSLLTSICWIWKNQHKSNVHQDYWHLYKAE